MKVARQAAESVAILAGRTLSLCCGLAGQSVALQWYADISGDTRFARRAYDRISRATQALEDTTSRKPSLGLWQGALGVALVAMSRLAGERSFPCIEPPLRDVGPAQGAAADTLFVLLAGHVETRREGAGTLGIADPGGLLAETSAFDAGVHVVSAVAR